MAKKLDESDMARLSAMLAALKKVSAELAPEIPLHNVMTLLFAGTHDNMSAGYMEIGEEFGLSTPAISRSLDSMGTGTKWAKRGYALLQRAEAADRRFKEARVTPDGIKLLEAMADEMRKSEERSARKGGR